MTNGKTIGRRGALAHEMVVGTTTKATTDHHRAHSHGRDGSRLADNSGCAKGGLHGQIGTVSVDRPPVMFEASGTSDAKPEPALVGKL